MGNIFPLLGNLVLTGKTMCFDYREGYISTIGKNSFYR